MSGVKISELAADSSVAGTELIPVSDSGVGKSVTITNIKQFVIDQIEAVAAGTAVTGADSIFILQGGVLKPVDIDLVAQHAIDTIWGKAAESAPASVDKLALKDDANVEKTVTLALLAEYVRATIEASILDISGLADGSGELTGTDYLLVTQGTSGKRIQLTDLNAAIYAALKTYVTALTGVVTSASTDVFYCIQGGVEKKVTLAEIATFLGNPVAGPDTTTINGIPQWSNATGTLKDGLTLATALGSSGDDSTVPSAKAVETALDTLVYDQGDIGAALEGTDTIVVDDGAIGSAQRKCAISRIWTYIQSVFAITDINLDGGADIGADLADADLILVDDGGAGTNRKCAISRAWTYIWSKVTGATAKTTPIDADGIGIVDSAASNVVKLLTFANLWTNYLAAKVAAVKIDDLTAGDDNTDLNASTSKHGLLVKATAPAANVLNVVGIANGETAYTNKVLFDSTAPAAPGAATAGTSLSAAHRDHVHDSLPFVAVDGTLATGANADFAPTKLVYNKTCSDSDGDDVIDLHDGTVIGQILTVYLGTKGGSDNAVITPVTKLGYSTITLDAANESATLQWQGATVGWAILHTSGTVA